MLPLVRVCLLSDATILRHFTAKLHTEMLKHYSLPLCPLESPDFKFLLSSVRFHLQLIKYIKIRSCGSNNLWLTYGLGSLRIGLTNSSVHSINTRNKHHLHRPIANLACFQKCASYSGIRVFNNLPQSITSLRNDKPQFKVALKIFLYAHSFYSLDEFLACTDDMYYWLIWLSILTL